MSPPVLARGDSGRLRAEREMAPADAAPRDHARLGRLLAAAWLGAWAARMKLATRWAVEQARHLARDRTLAGTRRVGDGNRRQECCRIRVRGCVEDLGRG